MLHEWHVGDGGLSEAARARYGPDMSTVLLTAGEVADRLRVSTMTVYRLIRRGELPAVRVGRNYRVRESDLDAYLEAQVVDPRTMSLDDLAEG
jgi:excisionase family DNA binding protein